MPCAFFSLENSLQFTQTICWLMTSLGLAATLDGLLLRVLPAVLFALPFYPLIGFQRGLPHIALFFCVLAVFSATVGALSMAVTVGFGTAGRAALVMNLVLLLSLLFAGFLVNTAAITPALRWVHYCSMFFYGFEALIVNEMSGLTLTLAVRPPLAPCSACASL